MKNIKNIIFDFGGVLYEINFDRTKDSLIKISEKPELLKKFNSKEFADFPELFEMGKITSSEFLDKMRTTFSLNADDNIIINAWNALLLKPFNDALEVLQKLSEKYNLYLLSNTNEIHFQHFYPQTKEIFTLFKKYFLSYEIGLRKPDEEIFEYVIEDLKIEPQETLFIDDSKKNIIAAQKTQLKTLHFVNQKMSDLLHTI
jgi:epoxide hydrolase-like predicted phosphatase